MEDKPISKKYQELAEKWFNGTISPDEEAVFNQWYNHQPTGPILFNNDEETHQAKMLAAIQQKAGITTPSTRKLWPKWYWAAAIILFGLGSILYLGQSKQDTSLKAMSRQIKTGGDRAFLTLNNGKRVELNTQPNGVLDQTAGVRISKTADGQLVYEVLEDAIGDPNAINTLETPKGGQYRVVLPDQTVVWLNAQSILTYPAGFAKLQERKVSLKGEAYFEVAKDAKRPFVVQTQKQEIQVLGTHFNVSAYENDPYNTTTLLEGSVLLNHQTFLNPGEEGRSEKGSLKVTVVDPSYATAWKDGKFRFQDENIKTIMRNVARWYNVEVVYKGNMDQKNFSGVVSRFDHISELLEVLESTNTIHFKIEGRRITVMD